MWLGTAIGRARFGGRAPAARAAGSGQIKLDFRDSRTEQHRCFERCDLTPANQALQATRACADHFAWPL